MSGFAAEGLAGTAATWIGALATIIVFGRLLGERRLFGIVQHLFAGLATGYLVVLAVREVLGPRLVEPLLADPAGRLELWPAAVLVVALIGARYLPRPALTLPLSVIVGGTAAFALGGAVAGTLLPQVSAGIVGPGTAQSVLSGALALIISVLVVLGFVHGVPRTRLGGGGVWLGRWLLIGGLGGWLAFLIMSRLALLVDRVGSLLFDWLGVGR